MIGSFVELVLERLTREVRTSELRTMCLQVCSSVGRASRCGACDPGSIPAPRYPCAGEMCGNLLRAVTSELNLSV